MPSIYLFRIKEFDPKKQRVFRRAIETTYAGGKPFSTSSLNDVYSTISLH